MNNFHYHFLKTKKELSKAADQMREIFDMTADKVITLTEPVETDIVVRDSPQNAILELGISGQYTKEARCIDVYLDHNNTHLKNNFDIFNWDFPEEAARAIDDINQNNRLINPGYPDFD